MRQHGAADDEHTLDIDPQHRLKRLERRVERRPHPGDAGIVDQQVDLPEAVEDGIDGAPDLVGRGDIGRERETAEFAGDRLRGGAVAVEHGHHHPLARQAPRDLAADAAAGAR